MTEDRTDSSAALQVLRGINWNFSSPFSVGRSGVKLFDCRKYHWYPATYIPELPHALIQVLTDRGDAVYDPFGGIGTTFFQAALLGRTPFSVENSGVPVMLVRAFFTLLRSSNPVDETRAAVVELIGRYDGGVDYVRAASDSGVLVEQLRDWYAPETFNQILYLASVTAHAALPDARAAMEISLSATLKAASAQDRGWGCVADNMRPNETQLMKSRDALHRCLRAATLVLRDIADVRAELPSEVMQMLRKMDPNAHILHGDARIVPEIPAGSIDLIVTSPPYPDMTDYSTSQRLSYYWLGTDPARDVVREIGARRKRFSADSLQQYSREMQDAIGQSVSKLRRGGYACFIMPHFNLDLERDKNRQRIVEEVLSVLESLGCVLLETLIRHLPTRRRHHNQRWTSLEQEAIYIYRKVEE